MRPLPIIQCLHQSLNGTCVAPCSSLSFWVGLFLGPALRRQSGGANSSSPSILSPSPSDIPSCPLSTSISTFCSFNFFQFLCCQPYKLVENGLTTHCQCQLKAGPVSSRQINMSIVYTLLCTSSLIIVPSRLFSNVRILFVQNHDVSSSDNLQH